MKIAVIHDYADVFRTTAAFPRLINHEVRIHTEAYADPQRMVDQVRGCDALLLTQQRVRLPRKVIEQLPGLKFVCQTGPNASHLDITACTDHGIVVSGGRHSKEITEAQGHSVTAELTWALILASLRHLPYEVERLKAGHWQSTVGTRLFGRVLGIYAFGHIGSAVARIGRAFGMKVVCWGREQSLDRARAESFAVAESRRAFFANADVLSLHLPAHAETNGIVTAEDLGVMKRSALIVNTSRGSIVDGRTLVGALRAGRPGYAALDVYEDEPLMGTDHPLLGMKNVLCTPHLGYCERESYEGMYATAVEQLLAFAEGMPIDMLNPDAWKGT